MNDRTKDQNNSKCRSAGPSENAAGTGQITLAAARSGRREVTAVSQQCHCRACVGDHAGFGPCMEQALSKEQHATVLSCGGGTQSAAMLHMNDPQSSKTVTDCCSASVREYLRERHWGMNDQARQAIEQFAAWMDSGLPVETSGELVEVCVSVTVFGDKNWVKGRRMPRPDTLVMLHDGTVGIWPNDSIRSAIEPESSPLCAICDHIEEMHNTMGATHAFKPK